LAVRPGDKWINLTFSDPWRPFSAFLLPVRLVSDLMRSFAPRSRKKDELAQVVGKKKLARQQAAIFSNPKRYAAFHIAAQVLAMN
jgi:hypothetical protein